MVFGFSGKKPRENDGIHNEADSDNSTNARRETPQTVQDLESLSDLNIGSTELLNDEEDEVDFAKSEKNTLFSESVFSRSKLSYNTNTSSMFSSSQSSRFGKKTSGLSSLLAGSTHASVGKSSNSGTHVSSSESSAGFGKNSSYYSSEFSEGDNSYWEESGAQPAPKAVGKPLRVLAPALDKIEEIEDTESSYQTTLDDQQQTNLFKETSFVSQSLNSPHLQHSFLNNFQARLGNSTGSNTSDSFLNESFFADVATTMSGAKSSVSKAGTLKTGSFTNNSSNTSLSNEGKNARSSSASELRGNTALPFVSQSFSKDDNGKSIAVQDFEQGDNGSHGNSEQGSTEKQLTADVIEKELRILNDNLVTVIDDIHQNVVNISRATIQVSEFFKKFLPLAPNQRIPYKVKVSKNSSLRSIIKVVLHFNDNLLSSEVYQTSKAILISKFVDFLKKLNIDIGDNDEDNPFEIGNDHPSFPKATLPTLKIYAMDNTCPLPNKENLFKIIEKICEIDSKFISDQNGAFIAPVIRGLSSQSSILTVMFGVPNLQQEHFEMIKALYSLFSDVHFYCVKDYIKPCSSSAAAQRTQSLMRHNYSGSPHNEASILNENAKSGPPMVGTPPAPVQTTLYPTYRLPSDYANPPISLSLSITDSQKITGTLGGYLYPIIKDNNEQLKHFKGSTFAITCAHVVLYENQDYPHVSVPSSVLQYNYKKQLTEAAKHYSPTSLQKQAYDQEIGKVDSTLAWQKENKFGQVVWGERAIINKKLSDFAIIKLNKSYVDITSGNYLGDDLAQSLPDPSLRFDNLYVTEKMRTFADGTEVFKYGSTTGYTRGKINGSKLVFWADGKIQSSEFVVASPTSPLFATGGDSGAWILSKLGKRKLGLGVLGMLHSYDGELKQFGLFSSITDILERLKTVTGVEWDIKQPKKKSMST
ncbi:hypothetical protein ACO0QE_001351 [Hanseniaspora vineae]